LICGQLEQCGKEAEQKLDYLNAVQQLIQLSSAVESQAGTSSGPTSTKIQPLVKLLGFQTLISIFSRTNKKSRRSNFKNSPPTWKRPVCEFWICPVPIGSSPPKNHQLP
jgi:hypothetical protein